MCEVSAAANIVAKLSLYRIPAVPRILRELQEGKKWLNLIEQLLH